jgi:hypothetical protein
MSFIACIGCLAHAGNARAVVFGTAGNGEADDSNHEDSMRLHSLFGTIALLTATLTTSVQAMDQPSLTQGPAIQKVAVWSGLNTEQRNMSVVTKVSACTKSNHQGTRCGAYRYVETCLCLSYGCEWHVGRVRC